MREEMERGGGEENLRHSRGDLSLTCSALRLLWFVAKKSSRDLRQGGHGAKKITRLMKRIDIQRHTDTLRGTDMHTSILHMHPSILYIHQYIHQHIHTY